MGLAHQDSSFRADNLIKKRTRASLEKKLQVARAIDPRFGMAEGEQPPRRQDLENSLFASVGDAHVKRQLFDIIGLLQRVLAAFGRTAFGTPDSKLLLPNFCAAGDFEALGFANDFFSPGF